MHACMHAPHYSVDPRVIELQAMERQPLMQDALDNSAQALAH